MMIYCTITILRLSIRYYDSLMIIYDLCTNFIFWKIGFFRIDVVDI